MKAQVFSLVVFLTSCFFSSLHAAQKADMVIFSYNRPMQLYALLESVKLYCTGLGQVRVIYRADGVFDDGYARVKQTFTDVLFTKQCPTPVQDFKPLTLDAVYSSPHPYVVFAVDDIIVKDFCDFSDMIATMETARSRVDVYGVYLRMGRNFTQCYSIQSPQVLPAHDHLKADTYIWRFSDGQHDWNYPNTVDMTLYRKADIEKDLRELAYENPNTLEGRWAARAQKVMKKYGIFFAYAKIVNVPLNRVQETWANRNMSSATPQELLEYFNRGLKIDIRPLFQMKNIAAHTEYTPTFVLRDEYVVKGYACCA